MLSLHGLIGGISTEQLLAISEQRMLLLISIFAVKSQQEVEVTPGAVPINKEFNLLVFR